jgi:hypothetical protein
MSTQLEDLRGQIAQLEKTIKELQRAPLPAGEIAAAVKGWLDDEADCNSLTPYEELTSAGGPGTILHFDPSRFLLNLFRSEIEQRLTDVLQDATTDAGLPAAKRAAKVAELQAQHRELERDEELLILRSEDRGETIERRRDVDGALLADVWHQRLADDGRLATEDAAA